MTDHPLTAWIEWKKQCALGLCTEGSKRLLQSFADSRFLFYARCYETTTNADNGWRIKKSLVPGDAWHLFETHMVTATTAGGKRYKDWLFARTLRLSGEPLDIIQTGASLIMRTVVCRHLRREYHGPMFTSLDDSSARQEDQARAPGDDLLAVPDPADETARREYQALADRHAEDMFNQMTYRERIAFFCREIGLALSHPAVERAAGCRKSMLHATYQEFFKRAASSMRISYPDDDIESVCGLTLMLIGAITTHVTAWARAETECLSLLNAGKEL